MTSAVKPPSSGALPARRPAVSSPPAAPVAPPSAKAIAPDTYLEETRHESFGLRSPNAEAPTPEEIVAFKKEGKDVAFSRLALHELHSLGDKADEFARREAVQGVVLSVDSYDTLDLDNALSFRREPDGSMIVGVHAVDLSAWIRLGSALDYSARRRVDTKYRDDAGLVVPMLPLSLCEGRLSLSEGQERLTKSVELHYSPSGELLGTRIFRSKLVNTARLDEADANAAARGEGRGATNPALADALSSLSSLAAKASGATDPNATAGIEKMLGFFTVESAKAVGDALQTAGLQASFRNQTEANARSTYGAEAEGHASVGAKAYATWTGPMRRYADLDVHRAMDRLIDGRTPQGRVATLDTQLRAKQLDRANEVTIDRRMDWLNDVIDATRNTGK